MKIILTNSGLTKSNHRHDVECECARCQRWLTLRSCICTGKGHDVECESARHRDCGDVECESVHA